jgi:4-hydroxybenzoate polyprenyltransferase
MALAAIDALLWSSVWLAAAAAVLTAAGARSLGLEPAPALLGLAFGGTLVVYVVDRLRDLERDRVRSPARAAFVERNRGRLLTLAAAGGALAGACALSLRPEPLLLTAGVAALGFAHRRLRIV